MVQGKILLIGSEVMMITLLRVLLESKGHCVFVARCIHEALESVQMDMVDVVVFDVNYLEIDIVTVIAEIHQMLDVPLIVLSSITSRTVMQQAEEAGASVYLTKPFSAPSFLDAITKQLLRA